MRNKFLLLNYVFVGGIILLLLNDHFLKKEFHNGFTGKFSDILGMIIFPLFLAFLFPKLKLYAVALSIVLFTFWKSPFSESLIDFYNQFAFIKVTRVVDYTDLIAFVFLIIPFILLRNEKYLNAIKIEKINVFVVLFPSVFAMMATSPPIHYKYHKEGYVFFNDYSFKISKSKEELFNELKTNHIEVEKDSLTIINRFRIGIDNFKISGTDLNSIEIDKTELKKQIEEQIYYSNDYIIKDFKINDEELKEIRFFLYQNPKGKTEITLKSLKTEKNLTSGKLDKKIRKFYRELLKKELFRKK